MKGLRTFFFNIGMLGFGLVGVHLSPETIATWGGAFVTVWGVGGIVLRQLTSTPIFQSEVTKIEAKAASLGLDSTEVQGLINQAVAALPTGSIADAVGQLTDQVNGLLAHPIFSAPVTQALQALASTALAPAAMAAPAPAPVAPPAPIVAPVAAAVAAPVAAPAPPQPPPAPVDPSLQVQTAPVAQSQVAGAAA